MSGGRRFEHRMGRRIGRRFGPRIGLRIGQRIGLRIGRRRPAFRIRRAVSRTMLVGLMVATTSAAVVVPSADVARADDSDLRPRLEAACARIPEATSRLQAAIDRLDGPASQRGSLAWFEAAITKANSNNRPRIAADLQRRLDRLTTRRATLDVRSAQLARLAERCSELGASA